MSQSLPEHLRGASSTAIVCVGICRVRGLQVYTRMQKSPMGFKRSLCLARCSGFCVKGRLAQNCLVIAALAPSAASSGRISLQGSRLAECRSPITNFPRQLCPALARFGLDVHHQPNLAIHDSLLPCTWFDDFYPYRTISHLIMPLNPSSSPTLEFLYIS